MTLWDSPRQREAYDWFGVELANLRTAFRWAADHSDLDAATAIAGYAGLLGYLVENYEPIAWAQELVDPAHDVDHPRLALLYVIASLSYISGRIEAAVRYSDAGRPVLDSDRAAVPYGIRAMLGGTYMYVGQNERTIDWCHAELARGGDTHACARTGVVIALSVAGRRDEAMAIADGLTEAAEATNNPWSISYSLLAFGLACRGPRVQRGLDALRRGLMIAQDSGNRGNESHLLSVLGRLEAEHGEPLAALDHLTRAIRNYHDSGNPSNMGGPLAIFAALLDRIGHYEPAAVIADYGLSPLTAEAFPEIQAAIAHLRGVLGEEAYEAFARRGEAMTATEMAAYAYDQIDQARTTLQQLR